MTHHRTPISIQLESFEGPLDLLLYLIQSHEMNVSVVSVSRVTDQYLAYIRVMHELNFDVASEFLVMAATLIYWKSKAILPVDPSMAAQEEELEDALPSQEELVRRLIEHQRFRAAGEDLLQFPRLHEDVFVRPNHKPPIEKIWKNMDITTLTLGYQDTMVRARKRKTILKKETVSLTDKILYFADRLNLGKVTPLTDLMIHQDLRPEIVVTFLASLELGKLKKLRLYQDETYAPIFVELTDSISVGDVALAAPGEAQLQ